MRVRIYPLALGKVVKHALVNPDKEVAGLLVGKVNGQVLEIWDAVTGEQRGSSAFVHLDEEVMAEVADWLMRSNSGLYIVGWYHSHPGFDVFLSSIDIETQRRYQLMFPKAVALVVDPTEYAKTRKISSLRFKVFRINREGRVVSVPVSIGIQRGKLLESTMQGLDTLDIRQIAGEKLGEGGESNTEGGFSKIHGYGLVKRAKKLLGK